MDGGKVEAGLRDDAELLLVVGDAAARAAQGIGGPDDDRIADAPGGRQGGGQVLRDFGGDAGLADGLHGVPELLAVLRPLDGLDGGAQQTDAVLAQGAIPGQLHRERQPGLAAEPRQQAVRPFLFDDAADGFGVQGLQVDFVRQVLVGHDGGGVGIDQHRVDALRPQHPAGLGAGIVKFGRLADYDRAGADYHHLADAVISGHKRFPPSYP